MGNKMAMVEATTKGMDNSIETTIPTKMEIKGAICNTIGIISITRSILAAINSNSKKEVCNLGKSKDQ